VAENYGRSVSGDFYDVVSGVGVGLGEVCDDYLVNTNGGFGRVGSFEERNVRATRFDQIAVLGSTRFQFTT
jgi:hypothetical protein